MTNIVEIKLNASKVFSWAKDIGIANGDIGYVVHSALCAAHGDGRLKPFNVMGVSKNVIRVLGYSPLTAELLERHRHETAHPVESEMIISAASKIMPDVWRTNASYSFELRISPTRRDLKSRKHKDAYLFGEHGKSRAEIYEEWLRHRIGDAVTFENLSMKSFCLTNILRRSVNGTDKRRLENHIVVPDVTFEGRLRVNNSTQFSELISSGIGRNRAFGFGTLLLKP